MLQSLRRWFAKLAKSYTRSPTFLLAAWFAFLLLTGTVLLLLPQARRSAAPPIDFLTALFTGVSAFCVTGLTVVDTAETFSGFGQSVLLLLIEMGGVGIMTFAALAFSIFGRRLSLTGQAALTDTLFQHNAALEFKTIFRSMLRAVVLAQLAGAAVLFYALHAGRPEDGAWFNLWSALFHSVSAFCNAGFAIYPDNLVPLAGNRLFLTVIMVLVIVGGVGHGVLAELYRLPGLLLGQEKRSRWLTLNSRVVLLMTATLLIAGASSLMATDYFYGPPGGPGLFESLFHSVVSRTAGFNAASLTRLPLASCLVLCLLMFIGGAPGSCAGGIKVTSLAIWIARIGSNLRHDARVNLGGYSIVPDLVSKARIIIALSTIWLVAGVFFLSLAEPEIRLDLLLFEQISAFATVGLSMGITPHLSAASRVWIILTMIMGKFGPLTIALWMVPPTQGKVSRPEGRIMIG